MGSNVTQKGRRRRSLAVALVVAIVAGTGYAATTAAGKSQAEPVTLTVSLFGDFGYKDLYKQYEKAHPGVTIKESIQDFPTHHSNLAKSVATTWPVSSRTGPPEFPLWTSPRRPITARRT